jgi:general secretion pathway protein M
MSKLPNLAGGVTGVARPSTLSILLAPAATWWKGLAQREQRLVGFSGLVLLLGLLWSVAFYPAWQTLGRAPLDHERLDAQLQSMQTLADESKQLRAIAPVNAEQAAAALKAATDRLGSKGKLQLQGERAVLTLTAVEPSQLRQWLAEARSGARARPVEATLTRATQGYSGTVTLALGAGTP